MNAGPIIKIGDHFVGQGGGAGGGAAATGLMAGSGNALSQHIQSSASGQSPSMDAMPKRIQEITGARVFSQFVGAIQQAMANAINPASLGIANVADLGALKLPLVGGKIPSVFGAKGRS